MRLHRNLWLHVAATSDELDFAQRLVVANHYLRRPVDPRSRPMAYILYHHAVSGADAAAGPRAVGVVIVSRPEAQRCYDGGLRYGSQADVRDGRADYDRWEILNLARFWLHRVVQRDGRWYDPEELPGFVDRRGAWRSTLATTMIGAVLHRVNFDYLRMHPPVDCAYPYQIRAVLSYCDTRRHKGTIYRTAGFEFARTNRHGIETWWSSNITPLRPDEDTEIRRMADQSQRSRCIRAQRTQLPLWEEVL